MGRILLCPLWLAIISTIVATSFGLDAVRTENTSYVIVTGHALVPGSQFVLQLELLDLVGSEKEEERTCDSKCVLELTVLADDFLWYRGVWQINVTDIPSNFSKTLRIMVPSELKEEKYSLHIESRSCYNFSHSVELPVNRRDLEFNVRTNKLVYRPGDLMLLEVLVFGQDFRPRLDPVNIRIYDSDLNELLIWNKVPTNEGIITEEFLIPLLASPDDWMITVDSNNQEFTHMIRIEKCEGAYVEEAFQVDVRTARYHTIHCTDEDKSYSLNVSVVASHGSGLPVVGQVELFLSVKGGAQLESYGESFELSAGHKTISLTARDIRNILSLPKEQSLVGLELEIEIKVEETLFPDDVSDFEYREEIEPKDVKPSYGRKVSTSTTVASVPYPSVNRTISVSRKSPVTLVDQSHVLFFSQFTPLYFKPGLTYVGQVLLKSVEELHPSFSKENEVVVKVKHFTSQSESPEEKNISLKVKSNSLAEFSFEVPKDDIKIELEATFEERECGKVVRAHLEGLLPFHTENRDGHLIQILLKDNPPKVFIGEELKAVIVTTFETCEIEYFLFSESMLVLNGKLQSTSHQTSHELSLIIPKNVSHLVSSPRLLVEALTPSKEIVYDSVQFVTEQRQKRRLEVEVNTTFPGTREFIEITVRGEPFTSVFGIYTMDALTFEPTELDIRKQIAYERMKRYLLGIKSTQFSETIERFCDSCSTIPSLAPDSQRVLNESQVLLLTDGVLAVAAGKTWPVLPCKNGSLDDLEDSTLYIIKNFDNSTWKTNVTIGESGEEKILLEINDTYALVTVSAFGLRPGRGLVVLEEPLQVVIEDKIMTSLRHPRKIIGGEEVVVKVLLFNPKEVETRVTVSLKETSEFRILCLEGSTDELGKFSHDVVLKPKQSEVVPIYIKSTPTGKEELEISVDIICRDVKTLNSTIYVKYQGYEVESYESFALDNFNGTHRLELNVLKDVPHKVEHSEKAHLKIYGHPLGPAIEHVCENLHHTSILEERTKMWFAIAANVLELISNNSLFENSHRLEYEESELLLNASFEVSVDREECILSARENLQYVWNLRKGDGSYSFNRKGTSSGYVWLTSFMLDVMVQSRNHVTIYLEDVESAVNWLLERQQSDGSFVEVKEAITIRDDFSEISENVPITSTVVISLLGALKNIELSEEVSRKVEEASRKAVLYLEKVILEGSLDNNSYSLNIAAYALAIAECREISTVLKKREKLVVVDGDERHFDEIKKMKEDCAPCVEKTAYAIMSYLALDDMESARPYVTYLVRRMKSRGVFVGTLDTYLALKALSWYYTLYYAYQGQNQINVDVNVTLTCEEEKRATLKILSPFFVGSLYFDNSNITYGERVGIETSGEGLILVQSIPGYNAVNESSKSESVELTVEVRKGELGELYVTICAKNLREEPLEAVIGEVPLLSGYELNLETVERKPNQNVYASDDEVYIVYGKIEPSISICTQLTLEKMYEVGNVEPKFVRLYPVNKPDHSAYVSYQDKKYHLKKEHVCPQ